MKSMVLGAVAAALAVGGANAAVVDFVDEAAGNERGIADGTTINFNGLDVTFSSLSAGVFFAYFDDLSNGLPGGLGVCEVLVDGPGSECANSGDDNIRSGEAVTLTFGDTITLSDLSFTDQNHIDLNSNDTNTLLIAINDPDDFVQFTFAEAVALAISGVDLVRFAFDDSGTGLQFYVNSFAAEVPLPAAAPLMAAGLAGLGFASRRRRKTA